MVLRSDIELQLDRFLLAIIILGDDRNMQTNIVLDPYPDGLLIEYTLIPNHIVLHIEAY